jgi:hypothetical protein
VVKEFHPGLWGTAASKDKRKLVVNQGLIQGCRKFMGYFRGYEEQPWADNRYNLPVKLERTRAFGSEQEVENPMTVFVTETFTQCMKTPTGMNGVKMEYSLGANPDSRP